MMKKLLASKKLKLTLVMGLLGAHIALPSLTSYAQTDEAAMEACPLIIDGKAIDTESSQFPTSSYELIDANLPADRVSIDESTLFTTSWVIVEEGAPEETYYQNYTDLKTYRDYSIWPMFILTYDSGEIALLAPANMSNDIAEFYTIVEFLTAQNEDLYHKLISDYMHAFSDDLDVIYRLSKGFPTSVFADGKANLLRAEALYADLSEDDPNYEEATALLDQIRFKYFVLEGRYNNACGADLYYDYFVYQDVEDPERGDELVEFIDASLKKVPQDLQERLFDIRIIRQDQLDERTKRDDLQMKAYSERILYFSEEMADDPSLVYYAVGQILDLSTYMPEDTTYEKYTSYSLADEWTAIHEAEWLDESDEEAVLNDPFHSFGQAFAAYALQKYDSEQMSDYGHEGLDITDHPESEAYFDDLFTRLEFN